MTKFLMNGMFLIFALKNKGSRTYIRPVSVHAAEVAQREVKIVTAVVDCMM